MDPRKNPKIVIEPRPCPVCNIDIFTEGYDSYDICNICRWVDDDSFVYNEPDEVGANGVSLNEAIENYKKYGICNPELLERLKKLQERKNQKNSKQ